MRFLTGIEIQTEVRAIASHISEVLAAVAYWGSGAGDRTGLTQHDRPANVRVICDLLSGACNPVEIEECVSSVLPSRHSIAFTPKSGSAATTSSWDPPTRRATDFLETANTGPT